MISRKCLQKGFTTEKRTIGIIKEQFVKPLLLGAAIVFMSNIIRDVLIIITHTKIGVGSHQTASSFIEYDFRYFVTDCFFPAVIEEGVKYIILVITCKILTLSPNRDTKWRIFIHVWSISIGFIFMYVHGPSLLNFYAYLLLGVSCGYLVVMKGYYASTICHMSFNFFSPLLQYYAGTLILWIVNNWHQQM